MNNATAEALTPLATGARTRPLDGVRVLDLSRFIAGPYAGRLLADLGADVVKIEPPSGDVTRLFGVIREGVSGLYFQQNAGKRNVSVDLKQAGAVELVAELAAHADVVIENFRPGVLDKLGLGYETLAARNPRIIMLSISGFGKGGPESQRQAYAPIIHAESGWIGRIGEMHGTPLVDSVMSFADSIAALHGMVGLLSALYHRTVTGQGQHLDIAMLDSWLATDDYLHYLLDGADKPVSQGGEVWDTQGGPLMLNRTLPHVWKLVRDTHGIRVEEPPNADLPTKQRLRRAAIQAWMDSFPSRDDLKRALEKADIAWGEVRTSKTILDSPTVAARGVAALVDDGAGGQRLVAQSPYRFSNAESGVRGGAPRRGQHNAEVLAEWIGLAPSSIEELAERSVLSAETQKE